MTTQPLSNEQNNFEEDSYTLGIEDIEKLQESIYKDKLLNKKIAKSVKISIEEKIPIAEVLQQEVFSDEESIKKLNELAINQLQRRYKDINLSSRPYPLIDTFTFSKGTLENLESSPQQTPTPLSHQAFPKAQIEPGEVSQRSPKIDYQSELESKEKIPTINRMIITINKLLLVAIPSSINSALHFIPAPIRIKILLPIIIGAIIILMILNQFWQGSNESVGNSQFPRHIVSP